MESALKILNATNSRLEKTFLEQAGRQGKLLSDADFIIVAIALLAIGLGIALFGVVTNAINIRTFIKIGIEDGVTTLFFVISFSDFAFVLLTCVRNTTAIMHMMEIARDSWLFPVEPIAIVYFSDNSAYVMYTTTSLISTFLAVARCMCVAKPLHFKDMFTRGRCAMAYLVCFLFSATCQIAVFCYMGTTQKNNAMTNSSRRGLWISGDRERVKDVIRLIMFFIIPIASQIIAIVCVAIMSDKLREAVRFRTGSKAEDPGAASTKLVGKELQVVKQVVLILLIYIVMNVQKIVMAFLDLFDSRYGSGKLFNNLYYSMSHLRTIFDCLNASVNFFVYFSYNSKFRSLCFSR